MLLGPPIGLAKAAETLPPDPLETLKHDCSQSVTRKPDALAAILPTTAKDTPMPLHSVDYMNARRDAKPASGGKRYVVKRNAFDQRSQLAALNTWERIQEEIAETLSDLNRAIAEYRARTRTFDTLAPGECFDDLCF